jgi:hypothetical protein
MIKTHDQRVRRKASFEFTASDRTAGCECPSLAERSSYLRLIVDAVNRKGPRTTFRVPHPIDIARDVSPSPDVDYDLPGLKTCEGGADLGFARARFAYSANNVISIPQYK